MKLEVLAREAKPIRNGSMLFVHGVCHDAHCCKNYLDFFSDRGFDSVALSLRGHGNSQGREFLHRWSLSDYVTDVIQVIASLPEKPVLVGHSMGGAITQKIIGEHPDLIRAAVLLAPAVKGGLSLSWKLKKFRDSFWQALQFSEIIAGKDVKLSRLQNSLFLNNRLSPELVRELQPFLQAESKRAAKDLNTDYTPYYTDSGVPILVIGSEHDLLFNRADLEKTAEAYGVSPIVLSGMCHDMMLDPEWENSAHEILSFVEHSCAPLEGMQHVM